MNIIRSRVAPSLAIVLAAACSRTPATAPAPTVAATGVPTIAHLGDAPINWWLLDPWTDHVPGISLLRAQRELLANKPPKRTVIVAVIDNGVDTAHAQLRSHLWTNPGEVAHNSAADDHNGFVDDVRGWDSIGGKTGDVDHDPFELTRLARMCADTALHASVPQPYRDRCDAIVMEFSQKKGEAQQTLQTVARIETMYGQILPYLNRVTNDSPTVARVTALQTTNDTIAQAKQMFLRLASQGITPDVVEDAKQAYASQLRYGFDPMYNSRTIVGDDYPDTLINRYGNNDVTGPGALHGTHVAGIIGGLPNQVHDSTVQGIAQFVRIMAIRVVPDGDERDKDVANGIRYAADNGAQVINMSFGK